MLSFIIITIVTIINMNKLLLFIFISAFSLFAMEKDSSKKLKPCSDYFIEKLKNKRYFYPVSAGLLVPVSLYGLSKTNFPLLKNIKNVSIIKKFLLFSGSGITAGALFLIFNNKENIENIEKEKNNTGLITRPSNLPFWLTDEKALKYLEYRIQEKSKNIKEENEGVEEEDLVGYIKNIVAKINQEYWENEPESEEQVKEAQVNDFLSSCDIEPKEYKVRIFDEYISFDTLVDFIKNIDREKLLYFLRNQSTIKYNLQGELINENVWKTVEAEKLAAFLAFGYYADTCGKFLYLAPDRLMTFLENAVYYMYVTEMGTFCSEEGHYYQHVTKVFETYCQVKITDILFKENGAKDIKKHPTQITVERISEEKGLKE